MKVDRFGIEPADRDGRRGQNQAAPANCIVTGEQVMSFTQEELDKLSGRQEQTRRIIAGAIGYPVEDRTQPAAFLPIELPSPKLMAQRHLALRDRNAARGYTVQSER